MKIAGRIIQEKNITENSEIRFSATYKNHFINVTMYKAIKGENPEWDIDVRHYNGGVAASTIVKRCTIRDAIIYALESSLLFAVIKS